MAYTVRIESFEGPFDLLLYLVSRQKVDIGSISITEIIDQYLAEIQRMKSLDLDVASDFLLVASTLLKIKAESIVSKGEPELDEDVAYLDPEEACNILVGRLVEYKKYKSAARHLQDCFELEGRRFSRSFGPGPQFANLSPDFLRGVRLDDLSILAVGAFARQERFLLDSEHIAVKPLPVETYVKALFARVRNKKAMMFSELLDDDAPTPIIVVSFLAILELYKRSLVRLCQEEEFGDIQVSYIEGAEDLLSPDKKEG